jgi:tetratricopeptide (TPR) repeat protein
MPTTDHTHEGHDAAEQGGGRGKPEHFHARQVEQFAESLAKDGELALQRWGFPLFHSLSDEQVQAQRQVLGFPLRDALDHYNHGCMLAGQGDFTGAIKSFDQALKLNPELEEAAFNRAVALEQAGNANGARDAWKAYVEQYPDSEETADVRLHLTTLA